MMMMMIVSPDWLWLRSLHEEGVLSDIPSPCKKEKKRPQHTLALQTFHKCHKYSKLCQYQRVHEGIHISAYNNSPNAHFNRQN